MDIKRVKKEIKLKNSLEINSQNVELIIKKL